MGLVAGFFVSFKYYQQWGDVLAENVEKGDLPGMDSNHSRNGTAPGGVGPGNHAGSLSLSPTGTTGPWRPEASL